MLNRCVFVFVILALPVRAGVTFHVAAAGDDAKGDGSADRPWRSIQKACDEMDPGDTVMVHAGIYAQRVELQVSGEKGKPVTLAGEPGAVLTGRGLRRGRTMIVIANQSWVRVMGLEIRETQHAEESTAIHVDGAGTGIEIRNCHLHGLKGKGATAIGIYGTNPDKPLTGIVIDGCHIHDCQPAESEALVLNGNIDGFAVTNNHVHDVNNIGIDFIGGEEDVVAGKDRVVRRGVCRGNRVERARASYGGGYAAGIYVDGGRDIVIEDNTVTQCDLGMEIGAENPRIVTARITVRGNRLFRNDKAGLVFGGYDTKRGRVSGCRFTGNILYHNTLKAGAEAEVWIQEAAGNEVKHNVISGAGNAPMLSVVPGGTKNVLEGNTWHVAGGPAAFAWTWGDDDGSGWDDWRTHSGQDASSVFRDPKFPDPDKGQFGALPAIPQASPAPQR